MKKVLMLALPLVLIFSGEIHAFSRPPKHTEDPQTKVIHEVKGNCSTISVVDTNNNTTVQATTQCGDSPPVTVSKDGTVNTTINDQPVEIKTKNNSGG